MISSVSFGIPSSNLVKARNLLKLIDARKFGFNLRAPFIFFWNMVASAWIWPMTNFCLIFLVGIGSSRKNKTGTHYVYPCQRFSTGNTLDDYNP
jgi:hypothetical protein